MAQNQILRENRAMFENREAKNYDLFLSHSYKDKELVIPLVELIQKCGYTVYVDWINDNKLDRNCVDKTTADLLRERMRQCKSLAYLTTSNTTDSKWRPWELGYYDGFSKNQRCCIIPVVEYNASTFKGQEYLGLYNYIQIDKGYNSNGYDLWVHNVDKQSEYTNLKHWLNGEEPKVH